MRSSFSISLSLLFFVTLLLSCTFTSHGKKTVNPYKDTGSEDDRSSDNEKKRSSISVGDDKERKNQRGTDVNNLLPPNTIKDKIDKERRSRQAALDENHLKNSNNQNKRASKSEASGRAGAVSVNVDADGTSSNPYKKDDSREKKGPQKDARMLLTKTKGSDVLDEDVRNYDDYDDYYDDDYDDYYDDDDYDSDDDDYDYDDYYDDEDYYDDYYDDYYNDNSDDNDYLDDDYDEDDR